MIKIDTLKNLANTRPIEVNEMLSLLDQLPHDISARLATTLGKIDQLSATTMATQAELTQACENWVVDAETKAETIHIAEAQLLRQLQALNQQLGEAEISTRELTQEVGALQQQQISLKLLLWTAGVMMVLGIALGNLGMRLWTTNASASASNSTPELARAVQELGSHLRSASEGRRLR